MFSQYGELRPTSGWDRFVSLGHPSKFQRVLRLGSVTARHSTSEHQPSFAALIRGCHLYSAGRPSRLVLAHISSFCKFSIRDIWQGDVVSNTIQENSIVLSLILMCRACGQQNFAPMKSSSSRVLANMD